MSGQTGKSPAPNVTVELREHTRNPLWNNGNGQLYSIALVTPLGLRWLAGELGLQIRNMDEAA